MKSSSAPRWTGFLVSASAHALLLAGVASIRLQPSATESPDARPAPLTAISISPRFAPHEAEADDFVVTAVMDDPRPSNAPRPQMDLLAVPEFEAAEPTPPVLDDEPAAPAPVRSARPTPDLRWRSVSNTSLHPGRGGARGGAGPATSTVGSIGVGASGVADGGGGSHGGNGERGDLLAGAGLGAGSDGSGSGWRAPSGPTRGPAIVGVLAPPAYPRKARSRGWEGRVVLVLSVDDNGHVIGAEVVESSGRAALDDAACETALEWTLSPALRDGRAVPGTLRVPVRFELTD